MSGKIIRPTAVYSIQVGQEGKGSADENKWYRYKGIICNLSTLKSLKMTRPYTFAMHLR